MFKEVRILSGRAAEHRKTITEDDFYRLHPKLVAIFRRQGASPEDARELTQETLMLAHKSLESFQGRSTFDTWVISIAKQTWLKDCRDRGRLKRTSVEEVSFATAELRGQTPYEKSHEDRAIAKDRLTHLSRSIKELPQSMRDALILHVKGHKYRAIAVLLDLSENRVSSLIHQARRKLRRQAGG